MDVLTYLTYKAFAAVAIAAAARLASDNFFDFFTRFGVDM